VTAPAASSKAGAPSGTNRLLPFLRLSVGLFLGASATAPVEAQVVGSVGFDSDYRLRGYSLTDGHPALSAQVSYDDPSGFYLGLSGLAVVSDDARFLGVIGNAGYARRVGKHATIDAGLLRSQIRGAAPKYAGFEYTEVYAGAYMGPVTARLYYSPDYRASRQSTLYGELEAHVDPRPKWRLSGHLGLLTYLSSTAYYPAGETHRDWRISAVRQLGKFELHAALSGGGPNTYYGFRLHRRAVLTVGGSATF
jgi:uncharacterized protein (TIGR02001 family)